MEEAIRLSGWELDTGDLGKRLCRIFLVLLLVIGLYESEGVSVRTVAGHGMAEAFAPAFASAAFLEGLPGTLAESLEGGLMGGLPDNLPGNPPGIAAAETAVGTAAADTGLPAIKDMTVSGETERTGEASLAEESVPAGSVPAIPEKDPAAEAAPGVVTVHLYGNGGSPAQLTSTGSVDAILSDEASIPERLGKVFDGWYLDPACTLPFAGAEDGAAVLELYAGWRDLDGFLCDDAGHILSCTSSAGIADGVLVLPGVSACTGISAGALTGVADLITEIYIPANITCIAPGAFDGLNGLMYIEAAPGNPAYYSEGGVLYTSADQVAASPVWYMQ